MSRWTRLAVVARVDDLVRLEPLAARGAAARRRPPPLIERDDRPPEQEADAARLEPRHPS